LKTLALFDFDGTITHKDSLLHFLKFAVGSTRFYTGLLMLTPVLVKLKMGWIDPQIAKEKVIYHFLKNFLEENLDLITYEYTTQKLPQIIRKTALERIKWHKTQEHEIYVVSASASLWLEWWCRKTQVKLIATELKFEKSRFSGKFLSSNCNGEEKVKRIKKEINLSDFSYIFAYGDTEGDKQMLELADEAYFRYFKD
jgi:phosphatidylglycerophosphatase C